MDQLINAIILDFPVPFRVPNGSREYKHQWHDDLLSFNPQTMISMLVPPGNDILAKQSIVRGHSVFIDSQRHTLCLSCKPMELLR